MHYTGKVDGGAQKMTFQLGQDRPNILTTLAYIHITDVAGNLVLIASHLLRDVHSVWDQDLATGNAPVRSWDAMKSMWQLDYIALIRSLMMDYCFFVEKMQMRRDADRAVSLKYAFKGLSVRAAYIGEGSAVTAFASAFSKQSLGIHQ